MTCLPCKEIIDNGMGSVAATLYAGVLEDAGITGINYRAPLFYAAVTERFSMVAKRLLLTSKAKLTDEQTTRLMAQIDKQCYRANDLRAWAQKPVAVLQEKAADWATLIFGWADEDQAFYTALAAEVDLPAGA